MNRIITLNLLLFAGIISCNFIHGMNPEQRKAASIGLVCHGLDKTTVETIIRTTQTEEERTKIQIREEAAKITITDRFYRKIRRLVSEDGHITPEGLSLIQKFLTNQPTETYVDGEELWYQIMNILGLWNVYLFRRRGCFSDRVFGNLLKIVGILDKDGFVTEWGNKKAYQWNVIFNRYHGLGAEDYGQDH